MDDGHEETIDRREAEILGSPPRIASLATDDAVRGGKERTARLREVVSGVPTSADEVSPNEMLLAMMHHAELYDCVAGLSVQLLARGALTPRDRELAILRTSWLCRAPYEFGEHVRLATMLAGVSSEEVGSIIDGSTAAAWDDHDRAVLRATEELHEDAMVTDDTWTVLAREHDEKQLIELLVLVGQATMVAYFQNACRFRLAPANKGLRAR